MPTRGKRSIRGRIALSATSSFREQNEGPFNDFIYRNLYTLCSGLEIISTEGTHAIITELIERELPGPLLKLVRRYSRLPISSTRDLSAWRQCIHKNLVSTRPSIQGMIEITHELVCGRLDAVIHLCDFDNLMTRTDSRVLRRQANVHNVPIASDLYTADTMVQGWRSLLADPRDDRIFRQRQYIAAEKDPLAGLKNGERVIALIAHNEKKLDLCSFVVRNAKKILRYDHILSTGTTGRWVIEFLVAGSDHGEAEIERKVRLCNSGPYGGDVQIAAAVIKKLCGTVIFFQDALSSHPHEADISLFEQALQMGVKVRFAANPRAAEELLAGAEEKMPAE